MNKMPGGILRTCAGGIQRRHAEHCCAGGPACLVARRVGVAKVRLTCIRGPLHTASRHVPGGSPALRSRGCGDKHLVAFSCKRRGCCPSYGAGRMSHMVFLALPFFLVIIVPFRSENEPKVSLIQTAPSVRLLLTANSRRPIRDSESCSSIGSECRA